MKGGRILLIAVVAITLQTEAYAGKALVRDDTFEQLIGKVQEDLLHRINRDRHRHRLNPVAWDAELARLATERCIEQLTEGTRGHYATSGLSPYVRYSRAGHYGLVSENVASWSTSRAIPPSAVAEMVRQSHNEMLMELPPDDGHRRAILDPFATHVGIGLAWSGGELRMIQAFSRRYVELRPAPSFVDVHSRPALNGEAIDGTAISFITVHWEPLPRPLSPRHADSAREYSFPAQVARITPMTTSIANLSSGRAGVSSRLTFVASFDRGPGIYTFVVEARPAGTDRSIPVASISITAVRSDLDGDPARLGR